MQSKLRDTTARVPSYAAVAAFALAITASVIAIGYLAGSGSFREAFLAEVGGTVIGALLGFLIATAIFLYERHREALDAAGKESQRRRDVLTVVRLELEDLRNDVLARTTDGERSVMVPPLTSDVWQAVSASGDLQVIKDPQLLRWMARAHRYIGQTRSLEDAFVAWEARIIASPNPYIDVLARSDSSTAAAIDTALAAIKNAMAGLGPFPTTFPDSDAPDTDGEDE